MSAHVVIVQSQDDPPYESEANLLARWEHEKYVREFVGPLSYTPQRYMERED